MQSSCAVRFAIQALVLLPAAAPLVAQHKTFALEQVFSAPFPDELTAARTGGFIAWGYDASGRRNVWVAGPPDYRGRQLTSYSEDDGQEITDIQFSADGKSIVYVRGGGANRQGEHPNPTSNPGGVEQAVWVVPVAGGPPRKISEGSGPAISPTGGLVAFVKGGQIWTAALSGGDGAPTQLLHARGGASSLEWSPDGSRLAFVSGRARHSFIGVHEMASKALHWIDPSVDQDGSPVWSPDGKEIVFLRTPTSTEEMIFIPAREGEPWSIRVADVSTGKGREVWHAERGNGSVFHAVVGPQLMWGRGGRIVFPWERDGWNHLYSVSASGGQATLLTPGDFEVEYVSLAGDGGSVLFNSNQGDINRRHLWRVPVSGGPPQALTQGSSLEWQPVNLSDNSSIAFLHSDATHPARPAVLSPGGAAREVAPDAVPADFPSGALVEPQAVVFSAADGMQIHGQLFLPPDLKPGERRPALVFFHGGSRRQMLLGFHYNYYYHNTYAMNQYLASRGYVVLAVNYRSGIGYGMEFREALRYGAGGASEFNDVLGAGVYLRGRSEVDGKRIGLWGGSYGGYLTAMGLSRASDLFAAGVDIHGVHNWNEGIRNFVPSYEPLRYPEQARLAFESSPLAAVKTWRSPVLLIHGDDDRNVNFQETLTLVSALRRQGVEFEQLVFPDDVHDFLLHGNWMRAYGALADFFARKLGGKL